VLNNILNFIFPEKCSWCWEYWKSLCKKCLENFIEREEKIFEIWKLEKKFSVYSPFFYNKNLILKKTLKEIKYKNKFSKFSWLSEKIFLKFEKFLNSKNILYKNIILIPIPLHWKKQLKRWFNQSEIFCNFLEKKWKQNNLNIKKLNLLKKIKNTKPQAESTKIERLKNLEWAFKIKNKFTNLKNQKSIFILIDDILSTWSTMKNCIIELKKEFPNSETLWFVICSDKSN